jgi:hypothetical protein
MPEGRIAGVMGECVEEHSETENRSSMCCCNSTATAAAVVHTLPAVTFIITAMGTPHGHGEANGLSVAGAPERQKRIKQTGPSATTEF